MASLTQLPQDTLCAILDRVPVTPEQAYELAQVSKEFRRIVQTCVRRLEGEGEYPLAALDLVPQVIEVEPMISLGEDLEEDLLHLVSFPRLKKIALKLEPTNLQEILDFIRLYLQKHSSEGLHFEFVIPELTLIWTGSGISWLAKPESSRYEGERYNFLVSLNQLVALEYYLGPQPLPSELEHLTKITYLADEALSGEEATALWQELLNNPASEQGLLIQPPEEWNEREENIYREEVGYILREAFPEFVVEMATSGISFPQIQVLNLPVPVEILADYHLVFPEVKFPLLMSYYDDEDRETLLSAADLFSGFRLQPDHDEYDDFPMGLVIVT